MGVKPIPRGQLCPWGCWRAECMAAAGGLVQAPASSGAGLVVAMVTCSLCPPCIRLRRARRRSKDNWVPLCWASRLVLSSRHFCQGERRIGGRRLRIPPCRPPGAAPLAAPLPPLLPSCGQSRKETSPRAFHKPGSREDWNCSQTPRRSLFQSSGLERVRLCGSVGRSSS